MRFDCYVDKSDNIYVNKNFNGAKGFRFELVTNTEEPVIYLSDEEAFKMANYIFKQLGGK